MSDKGNLIITDSQLSDEERRTLEVLVATMIPANGEYKVPAADDPKIFSNILARSGELHFLTEALQTLDELSRDLLQTDFSSLEPEDRVPDRKSVV